MKTSDAITVVGDLERHASALGHASAATALECVATLLQAVPAAKVPDAANFLASLTVNDTQAGSTARQCADVLTAYAVLIRIIGKAPMASGLEQLASVLRSKGETSVGAIVEAIRQLPPPAAKGRGKSARVPPNDIVVSRYLRMLEQALGDDPGFGAVMASLDADGSVTADDVIDLAKRFTAASTKTRPAALKKILSRHAALITSRARSAATAGRVAG